MRSIIFLVIVYIVKWIIDEISKPESPDVDQIINSIIEKKPIKYISNGVELKTTLKRHYFGILDMTNGQIYDRNLIFTQVQRQYQYLDEDSKIRIKTRCTFSDIKLAEEYIMNNYDYLINLN